MTTCPSLTRDRLWAQTQVRPFLRIPFTWVNDPEKPISEPDMRNPLQSAKRRRPLPQCQKRKLWCHGRVWFSSFTGRTDRTTRSTISVTTGAVRWPRSAHLRVLRLSETQMTSHMHYGPMSWTNEGAFGTHVVNKGRSWIASSAAMTWVIPWRTKVLRDGIKRLEEGLGREETYGSLREW